MELEDDNTAVPRTHIDDEYAHAGEVDPQVRLRVSSQHDDVAGIDTTWRVVIPIGWERGGLMLRVLSDHSQEGRGEGGGGGGLCLEDFFGMLDGILPPRSML